MRSGEDLLSDIMTLYFKAGKIHNSFFDIDVNKIASSKKEADLLNKGIINVSDKYQNLRKRMKSGNDN